MNNLEGYSEKESTSRDDDGDAFVDQRQTGKIWMRAS